MSLPRYREYKGSGADWLGCVPVQWLVVRLKSRVSLVTTRAIRRTRQISLENIESWTGRFLPTEGTFDGDGIAFECGDLLFGKLRPYLAKAYVAPESGEAVGDFHVLRCNQTINPHFLQFQILNSGFIGVIDSSTFGSKMPRISWGSLGNMVLAVPSIEDQSVICTFLDREIAKIDALIAEQQTLIALLAEKRQAIITHAVTKGCNPDVAMKDSGVLWMGAIPPHWHIVKLGLYASIENGTTPSRIVPEYWEGGDIPWLASGEVNQWKITEASEFITAAALDKFSLRLLPVGTVVVGLIGQGKTRGMSAMLCIPATINQNLAAICPGPQLEGLYVLYLLHAVYGWLREAGRGGNQAAMNCEMLSALRIPLPPLVEQRSIVEFIEIETSKIDLLRQEAERVIGLLKERRSALITAAVTGQIDVRGAVQQIAEKEPEASPA